MNQVAYETHATELPKILVVDDDDDIRSELTELLIDEDFDVVSARDAEEAMSAIAADIDVGVVLTDLRMPGDGGLELAARIQRDIAPTRPVAVVVITGHGGMDEVVEALGKKVVDFVTKPVTINRTLTAVERALAAWEASRQELKADAEATGRIAAQGEEILDLNARLRDQNLRLRASVHTKAQFMRSMGHELHTPLHHIVGGLEVLSELLEPEPNSEVQQWLSTVTDAADQLGDHLGAILELAQVDTIGPRLAWSPTNTSELIASLARLYRDKAAMRQQTINVESCAPLIVRMDRGRTLQALGYLLENASKNAPERSVITLQCRQLDKDGECAYVQFVLSDCGPGMDEATLRYAQDPAKYIRSTTRSNESMGLGIYLARRNVDLQGGAMCFSNRAEGGVRVELTLPLTPPAT